MWTSAKDDPIGRPSAILKLLFQLNWIQILISIFAINFEIDLEGSKVAHVQHFLFDAVGRLFAYPDLEVNLCYFLVTFLYCRSSIENITLAGSHLSCLLSVKAIMLCSFLNEAVVWVSTNIKRDMTWLTKMQINWQKCR